MNAKSYLRNLINQLTGVAELQAQVKELKSRHELAMFEIGNLMTESQVDHAIERATEDFISERKLNDAIEEAMNDQDWDSIVSDALGERHTSSVLEESVAEALENAYGEKAFEDAVSQAVQDSLNSGRDEELAQAIADVANTYNKTNLPKA